MNCQGCGCQPAKYILDSGMKICGHCKWVLDHYPDNKPKVQNTKEANGSL